MKALIKISSIKSDTRYAKEVRFLGIPIVHLRELNVRDENRYPPKSEE